MTSDFVLVLLVASAWLGIAGFYFTSTRADAETVEQ